ncbi:MAG: hypothetical protein RLZZ435_1397, partial [Cyanobacteriota bacterium]
PRRTLPLNFSVFSGKSILGALILLSVDSVSDRWIGLWKFFQRSVTHSILELEASPVK